MIGKLNHVAVAVPDLEKAAATYRDVLGARVSAPLPQPAEALPGDPETLKAMLNAERVRLQRLVQIIKELQRHRFGRRAETLPVQLLLAPEDIEQTEAGAAAEAEDRSSTKRAEATRKRRTNRGALGGAWSQFPRSDFC